MTPDQAAGAQLVMLAVLLLIVLAGCLVLVAITRR
jgi:hypothetical protein